MKICTVIYGNRNGTAVSFYCMRVYYSDILQYTVKSQYECHQVTKYILIKITKFTLKHGNCDHGNLFSAKGTSESCNDTSVICLSKHPWCLRMSVCPYLYCGQAGTTAGIQQHNSRAQGSQAHTVQLMVAALMLYGQYFSV